jgi:cell wall-active antibiotic response 4TMS protein YvqF
MPVFAGKRKRPPAANRILVTCMERHLRFTPQLLMGLLVIGIGVLFTLDNLELADAGRYLRYWPVGLIAIGAGKLWQSRGGAGVFAALLLIVVGGWLVLESARIVTVTLWHMWPMLLVFFGASMVWRGMRGTPPVAPSDGSSKVSALAVLGGVNQANNSRSFRGGDLTAVLGGCAIDLRQAAIDGEAVLDVFAMWGGIELRVPEDWTVIGRVVSVLGGFDDTTRAPQGAGHDRLIVRGFAIMGGIEIKN